MSRKHQRGPESGLAGFNPAAATAAASRAAEGAPEVKTGGWVETAAKAQRKDFPDPQAANAPLRIALSAEAAAEVNSHAKESLDAEVCGVLVGQACEDGQGPWVSVKAAIRGDSARQGGAHVTYTQETWQKIHEQKDRRYPNLAIVGWYHSHPGFGVEFSAMDMFIQENFFSGPLQIALVLDPLSGDEALCVNTKEGTEQVPAYWIDGRRRTCRRPAAEAAEADRGEEEAGETGRRLRALEERLQQVLQATDEDRASRHFWQMTLGMLLALVLIAWIAMTIARPFLMRDVPPEDFLYSELPVRIGNEDAVVGVKIIKWQMPPKLHAAFLQALQQQIEAEAKARLEAEEAKGKEEAGPKPGDKGSRKPGDQVGEKPPKKEKKP